MKLLQSLILLVLTLFSSFATCGYNSGINDIEEFKKELGEPLHTQIDYVVQGVRGLKDGYFSKYRHGKPDAEAIKRDEKCFGKEAEKEIYQIVYFFMRGELMDIDTVMDDVYDLSRSTYRYCAVYETTMTLYDHCYVKQKCDVNNII